MRIIIKIPHFGIEIDVLFKQKLWFARTLKTVPKQV